MSGTIDFLSPQPISQSRFISRLKPLIYHSLDNHLYCNATFLAERLLASVDPSLDVFLYEDALHLLGLCYFSEEKLMAAYTMLKDAEGLKCRYLFARCCMELEKFHEGIVALEAILTTENHDSRKGIPPLDADRIRSEVPDESSVLFLLGLLCQKSHRNSQATTYLKQCLTQNPFMWAAFEALCQMGVALDPTEIFHPLDSSSIPNQSSQPLLAQDVKQKGKMAMAPSLVPGGDVFPSYREMNGHQNEGNAKIHRGMNGGTVMSGFLAKLGNITPSPQPPMAPSVSNTQIPPEFPQLQSRLAETEQKLPQPRSQIPINGAHTLIRPNSSSSSSGSESSISTATGRIPVRSRDTESKLRRPSTRSTSVPSSNGEQTTKIKSSSDGVRRSSRLSQNQNNNTITRSSMMAKGKGRGVSTANAAAGVMGPPTGRVRKPRARSVNVGQAENAMSHDTKENAKGGLIEDVMMVDAGKNYRDRQNTHSSTTYNSRSSTTQPTLVSNDDFPPPSSNVLSNLDSQAQKQKLQQQRTFVLQCLNDFLDLLRLFGIAFALLSRYEIHKAIKAFEQLPTSQFESGFVLSCIGRAYHELVDYAQSEIYFAKLRRSQPHRLDDLSIYSTTLWHLGSEHALSYLAHELVQFDRLSPESWIAVGNCFSLQKDHENAVKCFQRAIQLKPNQPYAYTLQGHEFLTGEEYDKALGSFRGAIRVEPRHYNAWYGLGTTYLKIGKVEQAKYHFNRALEINPSNSVLHCCIGMVLEKLKKFPDALEAYTRGVQLNSKSPLVRFKKAKMLIRLEQYETALQELEALRDLAPDEANVYYLMGKLYKQLGDKQNAMMHFSWALDLDQSKSNSHIRAIEQLGQEVGGDDEEEEEEELLGNEDVYEGADME